MLELVDPCLRLGAGLWHAPWEPAMEPGWGHELHRHCGWRKGKWRGWMEREKSGEGLVAWGEPANKNPLILGGPLLPCLPRKCLRSMENGCPKE